MIFHRQEMLYRRFYRSIFQDTFVEKIISRCLRAYRAAANTPFQERWYSSEPGLDVSRKRRLELKKKGFFASADLLYDFDRYSLDDYVNFREYRRLHPINHTFSRLIDSKAFIPIILRTNPEWIPEFSVVVAGDRTYDVIGAPPTANSLETILAYGVESSGELFAKPCSSSGGRGAFVINARNLSEKVAVLRRTKSLFLVQNSLQPEKYSCTIFSGSINTIRVLFFRNERNEMRVLRILHRFGTEESAPVDNSGKGGVVCCVNISDGSLSKGVVYRSMISNGWHSHHINSGALLEGFRIPRWREKLSQIHHLLGRLSFLDYGGLDIAPTDAGLKLLEINSLPSLVVSQLEGPLLLDSEFAKLLRDRGYRG